MGSVDGFDSITLISTDESTEAEFVPDANMLCCSLRYRGTELLDHGSGVRTYAEHGKTMGIPLLHPWANRLAGFEYWAGDKAVRLPRGDPRITVDPQGLPIHGVLPGLLRWDVQPGPVSDTISARLRWTLPELLELFPFAHELHLDLTVNSGELTIATTLTATGGDPVPVSFGYHPYLRIPGTGRVSAHVRLGAFRRLLLDERMIPTGEREPVERRSFVLGDTSLDDGFDALAVPAEFEVAGDDVTVTVGFLRGYSYAQVYTPTGADFICFEPMSAPANALISGDGLQLVAPGEQYSAAFAIAISEQRA